MSEIVNAYSWWILTFQQTLKNALLMIDTGLIPSRDLVACLPRGRHQDSQQVHSAEAVVSRAN